MRNRKGQFVKRGRKAARRSSRKAAPRRRRAAPPRAAKRRRSPARAMTAPRTRRRSVSRASGIKSFIADAAAVTGGIVLAGAAARSGVANTPAKRAALVGVLAVVLASQAKRLGKLPIVNARMVNGAALGMATDAVWRAASPYVGNVPGLSQAAKAAGLLAGHRHTPRFLPAARASGPRSPSEALAFLQA